MKFTPSLFLTVNFLIKALSIDLPQLIFNQPSITMSDSHDGLSPIIDLSVVVEKRIRDMMVCLSTCIGEIAKEKQVRFRGI